ncbi:MULTISPECIES: response regulator transcription factor [Chryseobacterium]|uniref:Oxygen regulatory protein NreC n=2 Tax=Chryseobacterium TaxID=59732 RepID=A0A6N4X820_9FLAO|nr:MULTISPECIES: response regulator transcription factor [Chryseobacterium]RMZ59863.1 DNA-binding response regulator [Chryseobacterium nematophagum]CAA7196368.1 Oxygen regulatory protein NreC [Chryseobacterium potabilaquae]
MSKKILIADDHYVVRMGTAIILESINQDFLIDHAENYYEVTKKVSQTEYDLLILDIEMPGSIFESMVKELKQISPNLKIMIFTGHKESLALKYLSEGAEAYLYKSCEEGKIVEAVNSIFTKGYYYPQELLYDFVNNGNKMKQSSALPLDILSGREVDIYLCLIKGNGILEISNLLGIHMSTVSTHKKRIFKKLNINSLAELIHLHNRHYPA